MDILKKLAEVAGKLDVQGFYDEASEIDRMIMSIGAYYGAPDPNVYTPDKTPKFKMEIGPIKEVKEQSPIGMPVEVKLGPEHFPQERAAFNKTLGLSSNTGWDQIMSVMEQRAPHLYQKGMSIEQLIQSVRNIK